MSDDLIHILAELQRDANALKGRRRLLEYIRAQSGARLALLFVINEQRDALLLVERRGRHTRSFPSPDQIPLTGLFGAALSAGELLYIPNARADPRTLDAERSLLATNDDVILACIVRHTEAVGVLALCLETKQQTRRSASASLASPAIDEANVLICAALLSSYVPDEGASASPSPRPRKQHSSEPQYAHNGNPTGDIEIAIARERERIAGDIHDGVAQQLASVLHRIELAQRMMDSRPDLVRRQLDEAARQLHESIVELRSVIASPWPLPLETQGLEEALQRLAADMRRDEPSLRIEVVSDDLSLLPVSLETVVYRLAQEGLTNARKHSHAARITLRVRLLTGMLVVEISDDGRGFDPEREGHVGRKEHLGLQMMHSRVQQAGGTWEAQSRSGEGTIIRARFPLPVPLASAQLTPREREVLRLITRGMTNRAIAETLSVSSETVKSHLHHIMQKMRVHDRTQAAVAAARQQLV